MPTNDKNPNGPAVSKRIKISKTQQQMLLIALFASTALGVLIVLAVFFIRYINFNNKVIKAKDEAIVAYEKTIKNVGLCKDTDRDGKFSAAELSKCDPDALDSASLPGTLRYNIMVNMANNADLESVARSSQADCYDAEGNKIDWQQKFDNTDNDEEQANYLAMLKMCSALRVIPDAMPAQANEEALMSSLNQIFIISQWDPENLSPSGNVETSDIEGLSSIPITLSVESDATKTMTVLNNIERSIRTFDLKSATISWNNDFLTLEAQGVAYYTEDSGLVENNKTVYANDSAAKKTGSKK